MANKDKSPAFHIRTDYNLGKLDERVLPDDPYKLFEHWLHVALNSNIPDPNAFSLATCGNDRQPRTRIVLLRNYKPEGFSFFTNYDSAKGKDIIENPKVCMSFFWPQLQQQIRIDGSIVKLPEEDSNEYFDSRPAESRIGAWASSQSHPLESRDLLEGRFEKLSKEFEGKPIPRPDYWGGYLIKPEVYEFWQGRSNRLHDRIEYQLNSTGSWKKTRLYP